MKYSVITNTYKRSLDLVQKSIRSSLQQKIPPQSVILIDQNDPPLKLDDDILQNPLLKKQNIKTNIVSEARNQAKITDNFEWLVFCDDDGYMKEDYSEQLEKTINENPHIEIFAGSILRNDNDTYYSPRHAIGGNLNKFRNSKLLMGSNFAIKKSRFESLGKFDNRFGAGSYWGSGEETDFAWKAYFENTPMQYEKDLIIYHVPPYNGTLTHSINKAYRYGRGKGALACKWLIYKKQTIVVYEILEMLVVPLIKIFSSILKLKFHHILIYGASLISRVIGFFQFLILRN